MRLRRRDPGRVARLVAGVLVVFATAAMTGCDLDSLLDVTDPENLEEDQIQDPDLLPNVINGAVRDFYVAISGAGFDDQYLAVSGVFTDEYQAAGTFSTRQATDKRQQFPTQQGNTSDALFGELHDARIALDRAADGVEATSGGDDERIAFLRALEGYTIVTLYEGFCAPIPLSDRVSVIVNPNDAGPPVSYVDGLNRAITLFDAALGVDASLNLAKVGKARALQNLGRIEDAADEVADVPTSFVEFVDHSDNTATQENPIWNLQSNGRYTLSDSEGGNGLPYRSAMDPRVPWIDPGRAGFDRSTPLFINLRHPNRDSDWPFADGIEARLIEAEAAAVAGSDVTFFQILNDLRADVRSLMVARWDGYVTFVPGPNNPTTTLDPLVNPGGLTTNEMIEILYEERGFWLLSTNHRLGDLRRLMKVYGFAEDAVWPTGTWFKGGTFGDDVSFPVPFDESQNPNYSVDLCNVQVEPNIGIN